MKPGPHRRRAVVGAARALEELSVQSEQSGGRAGAEFVGEQPSEVVVGEAPISHHPGREALDHDVGPRRELPRDRPGLRPAEVERDAVLRRIVAGIELAPLDPRLGVVPGWAETDHVEPRVRLDADDGRAVVGKVLDRDRSDAHPGKVEDLQVRQGEIGFPRQRHQMTPSRASIASWPINVAAYVQLDAAIPNYFLQEAHLAADALNEILVEPLVREGGYVIVPDRPGIGVELREDKLGKFPYKPHRITGSFSADGAVAH